MVENRSFVAEISLAVESIICQVWPYNCENTSDESELLLGWKEWKLSQWKNGKQRDWAATDRGANQISTTGEDFSQKIWTKE